MSDIAYGSLISILIFVGNNNYKNRHILSVNVSSWARQAILVGRVVATSVVEVKAIGDKDGEGAEVDGEEDGGVVDSISTIMGTEVKFWPKM